MVKESLAVELTARAPERFSDWTTAESEGHQPETSTDSRSNAATATKP